MVCGQLDESDKDESRIYISQDDDGTCLVSFKWNKELFKENKFPNLWYGVACHKEQMMQYRTMKTNDAIPSMKTFQPSRYKFYLVNTETLFHSDKICTHS